MKRIKADGKTLHDVDDGREPAQARDVFLAYRLLDIGKIFPDNDMCQHYLGQPFFLICRACSCNSSRARRTCSSAVRMLPIASRSDSAPRNFVCEMNAWPVALTPCMIASLRASREASRNASVSPSTPSGRARKQTVLKGTGASNSQPGAASIHEAKRRARRQCSRMREASPSCPK